MTSTQLTLLVYNDLGSVCLGEALRAPVSTFALWEWDMMKSTLGLWTKNECERQLHLTFHVTVVQILRYLPVSFAMVAFVFLASKYYFWRMRTATSSV